MRFYAGGGVKKAWSAFGNSQVQNRRHQFRSEDHLISHSNVDSLYI